MNVLMAREVGKFARQYALEKGPILIEALTYRYKGHSMSDPEITYRTKTDVDEVRKSRDPIFQVHQWLVSNNLATEDELTEIEQSIKKQVAEAVHFAANAEKPSRPDLYTDVYQKQPTFTRGVELSNP